MSLTSIVALLFLALRLPFVHAGKNLDIAPLGKISPQPLAVPTPMSVLRPLQTIIPKAAPGPAAAAPAVPPSALRGILTHGGRAASASSHKNILDSRRDTENNFNLSAGFLENIPLAEAPLKFSGGIAHYVAPNEKHPLNALPILKKAPRGAYISVGAERGFLGAALAKNASHLVLADRDSEVVFYNRVNIALLQLAEKDRKKYLRLRFADSHDVWLETLQSSNLPKESADLLRRETTWKVWTKRQARGNLKKFNQAPTKTSDPFYGAHYLSDNVLFKKLSAMALAGRIKAFQIDFKSDRQKLKTLVDALAKEGIALSVLDLSNAWAEEYAGKAAMQGTMRAFQRVAADSSLLLLTWVTWDARFRGAYHADGWAYHGFNFKELASVEPLLNMLYTAKARRLLAPNALNRLGTVKRSATRPR